MTPTELLAALEAATGPSRELDAEIAASEKWTRFSDYWLSPSGRQRQYHPPAYTASLDSALTLVPEGRMWFVGHMDPSDMRYAATISEIGNIGAALWRGVHATPALALVIAAIRARGEG